jgi:hypothetical protein
MPDGTPSTVLTGMFGPEFASRSCHLAWLQPVVLIKEHAQFRNPQHAAAEEPVATKAVANSSSAVGGAAGPLSGLLPLSSIQRPHPGWPAPP